MVQLKVKTDVLVIGGGGAGLRAAVAAADCGAQVILVSKRKVGIAGATAFPVAEMAGYNAGDIRIPGDTQSHYEDIMKAAQGMADPKLAAITAANAPGTISKLEEWGVEFEHVEEDYYIFKSCFSDSPRTHVIKGHGEPIIKALMKQIELRKENIKIMDDVTILRLVKENECVCGAIGCRKENLLKIEAGAVIMATGGCGQAFARNMNPVDITGDGYAMAYEIGAELTNMEFMQIGMGFSWPVVNIFNGYIWEGKPSLKDKDGNDIFENVLPEGLTKEDVMHEHRRHFPFSSSDSSQYLEIAVQRAIRLGKGTDHGGVHIDLSCMTDEYVNSLKDDCGIHHMWPIARDYMKTKGVDLLKDHNVEVAVYAHAVNGGIRIDENAMSSVEGLFAAGECAGGPHGADRLGGNMMVTCQVYGEIAGTKAAEYAIRNEGQQLGLSTVSTEESDWKTGAVEDTIIYKKADLESIKEKMRDAAQMYLLVDRDEEGLSEYIHIAETLKKQIENAPTGQIVSENVNVYHALIATELMAESARKRKESRGSHQRRDYPKKNEAYSQPIIIKKQL